MKLLIGGSPCTHWSIAQTKNRETTAEGVGWELFKNCLIALGKYKPDYFLYENNKSMSAAIREQITRELGVEPIMINSALVSAQSRQRLYWTNIPGVDQPEDRGILFRDILESGVHWREKAYTLRASAATKQGISNVVKHTQTGGKFGYQGVYEPIRIGTIENDAKNEGFDSQQYRVYSPDGKSVTLCGNGGVVGAKTGLYATPVGMAWRGHAAHGNTSSFETRSDGKSNAVIVGHQNRLVIYEAPPPMRVPEATAKGYTDIAPGECVDLAQENSKTRRGRRMAEKSNCLTTTCSFYEYCGTLDYPVYQVKDGLITIRGKQYPIKLRDGCYTIRKLTMTECKRLPTIPDSYIFPVSDTQAYKMLGNGWTVDVIVHILGHIPGITEEEIEVLSMYDGMACGHIALDKLGAHITRYFATEIDKYAIKTATRNYPDIIELGDAYQVRDDGWAIPHGSEEANTWTDMIS